MNFRNKKIAILGWGMNGLDAYEFLTKQSAGVSIYDQKKKNDLDFSKVDEKKVKIFCGNDYLKSGLGGYDYIFRAPGVYRYLPEIVEAEKAGVIITSVTDLFFTLCPAKIIGVTGTKGKGTTSTLIYQILQKDGKDVYLAGNIGVPMLDLLPKLKKDSWVVLELSSFQLIDLHKSPHIAVVLNITEDHLDWHKDKDEYIKSKAQIVKFQNKRDFAVLNYDYLSAKSFNKHTKATIKFYSNRKNVNGAYVSNGKIILKTKGSEKILGKTEDLLLRGEHNWENVCAATCASYIAGTSTDSIKKAIFSFKGLEHRLELVGKVSGRAFYNDSFSTNPQTTIAAIKSFSEPITLVLGGSDKGLNYDGVAEVIKKRNNVRNVVLIGEISDVINKSLVKAGCRGNIKKLGKVNMKSIVKKCFDITLKGGVVLLSPATASFDMFKDYKDRGNQFKAAIKNLTRAS